MQLHQYLIAGLAMATAVSAGGLCSSPPRKLLHASPPITPDVISMFPGRHPQHDGSDLDHLVPKSTRHMYFAQEGHRSHIHGSKHAEMTATFNHPTVVLDNSDHLKSIKCRRGSIEVCFKTTRARQTVERSWRENTKAGSFHLLTYHPGCGDKSFSQRSYFRASQPVRNTGSNCVSVPVASIDEQDALESGEVSWGSYADPKVKRVDPLSAHSYPHFRRADGGDGTVDIDHDLAAAEHFFNITTINPDAHIPADSIHFISPNGSVIANGTASSSDTNTKRHVSISPRVNDMVKRDFFGISENFFQGFADVSGAVGSLVKGAVKLAEAVIEYGADGLKLAVEAFTNGIDRPFKHKYEVKEFLSIAATNKGVRLFGDKGFLVYKGPKEDKEKKMANKNSKLEAGIKFECVKCGIEGTFEVDGRFAFHISDGIRHGNFIIDNLQDLNIYAHIGITVNGKYPILKEKKQLGAVPVTPITIPGIFTLGPEVTFSSSFNVEFAGEFEVLIGGTMTLSKGKARLDLKEKDNCGILEGLKPSFEPLLKVSGKAELTAAVGLPIGLELGVDILNGKFKATVGLIDTPSVYISGTAEFGKDAPCKGVEVRLGMKNKIEANAFDLWSLPLNQLTLIDQPLGCVTASGFDKDAVKPGKTIFDNNGDDLAKQTLIADINRHFGGADNLAINDATKLRDIAARISSAKQKKYWSLITDKDETSLVVSGKDGKVYLTKSSEEVQLLAPWGTPIAEGGLYAFDSEGRALSYDSDDFEARGRFIAEIQVHKTTAMPKNNLLSLIARLRLKDKSAEAPHGIFMASNGRIYYPTFCRVVGQGMRLFATEFVVGEGGKVIDAKGNETDKGDKHFEALKLTKSDCRTVNLISSRPSTSKM